MLFAAGQILGAGHINYQQEAGYHEINPIYGEHPSKSRVYVTKAAEMAAVYGLTRIFPRHEKKILGICVFIQGSFLAHDVYSGISLKFKW